ncbi:MAG TPA: WD40 repeat domain-containing protein [Planctomycetes bacterium]|nr:WD40 repeat domain-containing protein [Planctomycetota bacterium]
MSGKTAHRFVPLTVFWAASTVVLGAQPAEQVAASRVIELAAAAGPEAPVITAVAIDPGARYLVAGGDDHRVWIWDLSRGELLERLPAHTDWVRCAAFDPTGQTLVTAGDDGQVRFWALAHRRAFRTLNRGVRPVRALAFDSTGELLAVGGRQDGVWVIHVASGRPVRRLEGSGADTRAVVFSPDGQHLAAAGRSGRVRVWEVASGRMVSDMEGHRRRVRALAYSPDAKYLASAGEDRTIRIWEAGAGTSAGSLPAQAAVVLSLAFCGPNHLAVGSSDNLIRVWNLDSMRQQWRLVGHTGSVTALVWNAREGLLVSGSYDTTVRLWQLPPSSKDVTADADDDPKRSRPTGSPVSLGSDGTELPAVRASEALHRPALDTRR